MDPYYSQPANLLDNKRIQFFQHLGHLCLTTSYILGNMQSQRCKFRYNP